MQIVYHGSYCKVEHPEIKEGKYSKDFGVGFYCTILEEQAIKWAKKYDTPNQYLKISAYQSTISGAQNKIEDLEKDIKN